MSFDFQNKVVLITGGAIGIGACTTKILLEQGVKHVAVSDLNEAVGKQLEQELCTKYPGRFSFTKFDVTKDEELSGFYEKVLKEYGYIDVVINNAGLMNDSPSVYKKEIEVNVTALVSSTMKARDIMRKDRGGKGGIIVNISSIAALLQHNMLPIYYATKSAVLQFSCCLGMKENYERTGVKIITMCFGATDTSLLSTEKLQCYEDQMMKDLQNVLKGFKKQRVESAVIGMLEACKRAESGSTWLVVNDEPVKDITPVIKKAYDILSEVVF